MKDHYTPSHGCDLLLYSRNVSTTRHNQEKEPEGLISIFSIIAVISVIIIPLPHFFLCSHEVTGFPGVLSKGTEESMCHKTFNVSLYT